MVLLGIDYGERQVGLALSAGDLPTPLIVVNRKEALPRIKKVCEQSAVGKIIIGRPEGRVSQAIEQFASLLRKELGVEVVLWDEMLTSYKAQEELMRLKESPKSRQQKEHAVAAALILQSYIDTHH